MNENLTTMARIKQVLYTGIVNTLMGGESNTGSEDRFSGALSLLGLKDEDKTNLGVGLGAMVSQLNKGYEASFTLSTPQDNVTTIQKVDEEAVEKAQKEYTDAYNAYKEAEDAALLANSRYNDAKDALYFARNDLSDIKMGNIDLEELETKLAEAKDQLAKDTEALQTAKEVLAIAQSNATDVATALKQAKEELKTAKSEKATADETLATAKSELEVLTKANTVAKMALTKANKELDFARTESQEATKKFNLLNSALTNREAVLKDLGTKLATVEAKIATIRAELETAKEELTRLEGISKAKEEDYLKVKSLKDAQDKAEAEAKRLKELKEKEDSIRNNGGQPVEVHDATGKVVDIVDAKAQNKVVDVAYNTATPKATAQETAKAETKQATQKVLPNTGEASSMLPLVGTLLGMGVIGAYRKRKDEE